MYCKNLCKNLIRLVKGSQGSRFWYSSFGKPSWPSGPYPPPGSVPPPKTYPDPPPKLEPAVPLGCPQMSCYPGCPTPCCFPPGCPPPCCPPMCCDTPPLCPYCRGCGRLCTRPFCYPGPVPYNPCRPYFPKGNYRRYKYLFIFFFIPSMILASLNAFGNEKCPKCPCRQYEYMRRRTKRFPWGDGNTSFFHNDHVNHYPEDCKPPHLIVFPDPADQYCWFHCLVPLVGPTGFKIHKDPLWWWYLQY